MTHRLASDRFIGRQAELATVRRLLRASRTTGATAVVRGDAGVGKTRFLAEITSLAAADGLLIAQGACLDLAEAPLPFGPVAEMLRELVDAIGAEETVELLGPAARDLARLLPGLGIERDDAGDASRARLFETVRLVLERVAARRPLLLVVEDVHWADRSTHDLLAFLVANVPAGALLVLTFRNDALPTGHLLRQFVAEIGRRRDVTTIELSPFDHAELAEQLGDILGLRPDAALVRAVWERSEGNPFFAEELASLARAGDRRGLPPTLHELLIGRLAALSPDARRVLTVAAVGGRRVSHRLLAAVAIAEGIDGPTLAAGLREANEHQVLTSDGATGYVFRHALLQETAYAAVLPGDRISLHGHYGRVLEAQPYLLGAPRTRSEVARHWFLAGDPTPALRAALEAARSSEAVCGFAEALQHLDHALELWGRVDAADRPDTDEPALVEWAARIANLAGEHRRAVELVEAALASTDDDTRRALLYERLGRYQWAGGDGEAALVAYGQAVTLVPPGITAERARVLGASARGLMLAGSHADARQLAADAAAIALQAGATAEEGRALGTLGFTTALLGDVEDGLAMVVASRRIAEIDGDPNDIAEAYLLHTRLLSGPLCQLEAALAVVTEGMHRVADLGLDRDHGVSMQALAADTLFRLGRWEGTDALLAAALDHDPLGVAGTDLYLSRAKLSVGRGDFGAARDDLDRASVLAARTGDPALLVPRCTLEAGLALWQGNIAAARAAVDEGLEHLTDSRDPWLLGALLWHGLRAEADAVLLSGDVGPTRARCAALLDRAAPLLAATGTTTYERQLRAYGEMCAAEAARVADDEAATRWSDVADRWDALGQPYPAAYARWKCAEALLAAGRRPPEARSLLVRAHEVASGLGAVPFRDAIERLASRARIALHTASAPQTGPAVLTSREAQVLELVATGASNREIASMLFISDKTVSVHVSNILAKLGARSRTEAAALARQLGLTTVSREG